MATVYIETTIPSYYHETRRDTLSVAWRLTTRQWWDEHREHYSLITSRFVIAELTLAPEPKRSKALALASQLPTLEEPVGFEELIQYYIGHRLMPQNAKGDAAHLAMATLHELDYLLTWNCQHLANVNKLEHLSVLNRRRGLKVPTITTPMSLLPPEES